jgi:hypothetical protein
LQRKPPITAHRDTRQAFGVGRYPILHTKTK